MAEYYYYWRYRLRLAGRGHLNAVTPAGEIEGALLRDRHGGHACLQPWPSLGQGNLDQALAQLRGGQDSDLLLGCRRCMAVDGAARAAGIALFDGKTVPRSHLTVPEWADLPWLEKKYSQGFALFKLKCGRDLRSDLRRIGEISERFAGGVRLRLDFNECLDLARFREFVELLGSRARQIDFIEDPLPYQPQIWGALSRELPFALAVDRAGAGALDGFSVRVVKPAWEVARPHRGRVVITSAMDHPLGQLFAAHEAATYPGDLDDCGLLTHWLYEPNQFSEALAVEDRRLVAPGGVGLGLGELLDELPWKAL